MEVWRLLLARWAEVVDHTRTPEAPADQLKHPVLRPVHREVNRQAEVGKCCAEQPVHDEVMVPLGRRLPSLLVLLGCVDIPRCDGVDDSANRQRQQGAPDGARPGPRDLASEHEAGGDHERETEVTGQERPRLPVPEGNLPQEHIARLEDVRHQIHGVGDGAGNRKRGPEGRVHQHCGERITHGESPIKDERNMTEVRSNSI